MPNHTAIHYYGWDLTSPDHMYRAAREFLDHGCSRFVFATGLVMRMLEDASFIDFMKNKFVPDFQAELCSMHAPWGPTYDLNIPTPERRPGMLADHLRCLEIAAEFGCKTYTVHLGAYHYCFHGVSLPILRDLARNTLETLLPRARELGIVIAVENSFEPPNTTEELLALMNQFDCDPYLGICYDTGHANCRASAPWKEIKNYPPCMLRDWLRDGRIITEDNIVENLSAHIVTTHIHDNDGYGDLHSMPGDGTIDWNAMIPKLKACPRMIDIQSEVSSAHGVGWAGVYRAPIGGYSIKRLVEVFRDDLGL